MPESHHLWAPRMRTLLIAEDHPELAASLAAAAKELGLSPLVAGRGMDALALVDRSAPLAALVGLSLPDMRGPELVRRLSARAIPCASMGAVPRDDPAAKEALEAGAIAFVQEPFAPREVLEGVLARLAQSPPRSMAAGEMAELLPLEEPVEGEDALEILSTTEAGEGESDLDDSDLLDKRHLEGPESALSAAALDLDPQGHPAAHPALSSGELAAPGSGPGASISPLADVGAGLRGSQPAERTAPTPPLAGEPAAPPAPAKRPFPWPPEGSLAERSLARLLAGFHERRWSGELRLRHGEVLKVVGVIEGRIRFAASNVRSERLGSFASRAGRLTGDALARVQAEVARSNGRTADAMIALGLLSRAELTGLVAQQVREIVWSALEWLDGTYRLALAPRRRPELQELGLEPLGPLILEGFRRGPSLLHLRELVAPSTRFEPAPDPPFHPADLGLAGEEALVLAHADGTKDVEDLIVLSGLGERAVLAILRALWQVGVLRPHTPPVSRRRVVLA
jgi:DNA-binding response OmpR family regulator